MGRYRETLDQCLAQPEKFGAEAAELIGWHRPSEVASAIGDPAAPGALRPFSYTS